MPSQLDRVHIALDSIGQRGKNDLPTLRSLKRVHARSLIFRILALPTRQISTVRSLDDKNL